MANTIPEIRYLDATNPDGLTALEADARKIMPPNPIPPPQPINANIDEFCKQVRDKEKAKDVMNQTLQVQRITPRQPMPRKNKRKYSKNNKYTQEQRDLFSSLYEQHQKKWTLAKYALKVGVPVGIIGSWRSKMIHHQSLQYCSNRNAYRNLLSDDEIRELSNMLDNDDASMTEKEMRAELEKKFPDSPKVSLETIDRALHGNRIVELTGRDYSLKVGSFRSPSANTPENKERRIQVMAQLHQYISQGRIWVSVDETHWEISDRRKRAWSKVGQKAFTTFIPQRTKFSSITAIDERGKTPYCLIVKGSVTALVFENFFEKLVGKYNGESAVFFLDNAPVHNKERLGDIAARQNQIVLFNAPYSEELNPIEMFFNEWKGNVGDEVRYWPGVDKFLDTLKHAVVTIPSYHIRKLFEHVRNEVIPKVIQRENL